MIEFSKEQKKMEIAYELLCNYRFDDNEIKAFMSGISIYKILADKIYVLEDKAIDCNENIEKCFENKNVLEMLKDNSKRQEVLEIIENFKLKIKCREDSELLKEFDSVISILKNLDDIVNKIENECDEEKVKKHANGIMVKLSSENNTEIKTIASEPIISKETFEKAKLNYKKQTNK